LLKLFFLVQLRWQEILNPLLHAEPPDNERETLTGLAVEKFSGTGGVGITVTPNLDGATWLTKELPATHWMSNRYHYEPRLPVHRFERAATATIRNTSALSRRGSSVGGRLPRGNDKAAPPQRPPSAMEMLKVALERGAGLAAGTSGDAPGEGSRRSEARKRIAAELLGPLLLEERLALGAGTPGSGSSGQGAPGGEGRGRMRGGSHGGRMHSALSSGRGSTATSTVGSRARGRPKGTVNPNPTAL